ncbi:accessory gene regulator B family protein [Clostridium sp. CCUG 7971]|uniref:accessory gene regulator ArgB-like protein n=1 Tax=Clostridium sp. CCUG 7971 TaxID=2811414 RepID=UPI001ABB59D7|nr:accessory gene regulator B family protein [Clostridium sp. CCUG 7971]MBO3443278.1 accessory gene regulator B family protein [Clostridium sp. CCUG 7971]
MGCIEKISLNLSDKLGTKLNKTSEEKAVLNYGLFVMLHTGIGVVITFLVGLITGMVLEMMIISVTTAWLKRYTGGVHASTPERCAIIGVLLSFILSIASKNLKNTLNIEELTLLTIITLSFSYYIVYKNCPVPSKNKPMKKESTRKKLKRKAFKLINMYLLIILLLSIMYLIFSIQSVKIIWISVLLGIGLQMIVVTNIGSKFICMLDTIFYNIEKLLNI